MAVKKNEPKNGGKKPTMQPEKDMLAKEPGGEAAQAEREAIDAMSGALEAAAECSLQEELDKARVKAQTVEAELTEALAAAQGKADEYLDLAQHVQADFDNYRRRNQSVRAEAYEDGARAFIVTLLPVLDNLERALHAAGDAAGQTLVTGVEMVQRQLSEALARRGVTAIERKGEKFDPNLENAVLNGAPEDGEPGTVCEVLQKGYQMGGYVLRHAMVKVVPE
jgi:molecular chaperone GrpE